MRPSPDKADLDELARRLAGVALLSHQEIVGGEVHPRDFPGVYFLIRDRRVVYVGQSTGVIRRVGQHGARRFDSFAFVPCDVRLLDIVESLYIHLLQPPDNGNPVSGERCPPLSIAALRDKLEDLERVREFIEEVGGDPLAVLPQ